MKFPRVVVVDLKLLTLDTPANLTAVLRAQIKFFCLKAEINVSPLVLTSDRSTSPIGDEKNFVELSGL